MSTPVTSAVTSPPANIAPPRIGAVEAPGRLQVAGRRQAVQRPSAWSCGLGRGLVRLPPPSVAAGTIDRGAQARLGRSAVAPAPSRARSGAWSCRWSSAGRHGRAGRGRDRSRPARRPSAPGQRPHDLPVAALVSPSRSGTVSPIRPIPARGGPPHCGRHVSPLPDVLALPVQPRPVSGEHARDLARDELLDVLVGAIVVGAVGDRRRDPVRTAPTRARACPSSPWTPSRGSTGHTAWPR